MNDMSELLIVGGLDQPIPTDNSWVFEQIELAIEKALEAHNPDIAINTVGTLYQLAKIAGLGLAKGLYLLKKNWYKFGLGEEEFKVMVYPKVGLHPATIERYIEVWTMFESGDVPLELKEALQQRNIKELIPIAKTVKQGYEIDPEEWEELAEAPDFNTIATIIREDIKGKPPRKGSLILMEDEIGTIWAFLDNERYFVGSLEVKSDDEAVQQSIERIRKNAGIMKS